MARLHSGVMAKINEQKENLKMTIRSMALSFCFSPSKLLELSRHQLVPGCLLLECKAVLFTRRNKARKIQCMGGTGRYSAHECSGNAGLLEFRFFKSQPGFHQCGRLPVACVWSFTSLLAWPSVETTSHRSQDTAASERYL